MTKAEANKNAEKAVKEFYSKTEEIEIKAKEDGTWCYYGLDSNNHLFRDEREKLKEKLKQIELSIDE